MRRTGEGTPPRVKSGEARVPTLGLGPAASGKAPKPPSPRIPVPVSVGGPVRKLSDGTAPRKSTLTEVREVCVLGPSGGGKSELIQQLNLVMPLQWYQFQEVARGNSLVNLEIAENAASLEERPSRPHPSPRQRSKSNLYLQSDSTHCYIIVFDSTLPSRLHQRLLQEVRRTGKPYLVCLNKADHLLKAHGFREPNIVSAVQEWLDMLSIDASNYRLTNFDASRDVSIREVPGFPIASIAHIRAWIESLA